VTAIFNRNTTEEMTIHNRNTMEVIITNMNTTEGGLHPEHGWSTSSAGIRGPRPAIGLGKEIKADIAH
jgi:hypothetical protein